MVGVDKTLTEINWFLKSTLVRMSPFEKFCCILLRHFEDTLH